ncbi:MAG TPA: HEAT repeat domain-containing protein [Planctomycetota bacterium]|jgi:HEAT repeat protein
MNGKNGKFEIRHSKETANSKRRKDLARPTLRLLFAVCRFFVSFGFRISDFGFVASILLLSSSAIAANPEPPPDPGFEVSVHMADVIAEVEIIAGGPLRAAAQPKVVIKGELPPVFELEGFNSYTWDTVHQGFAAGAQFILFLSKTERPDCFTTLTPAAPRLTIFPAGTEAGATVLLSIGDPPFRVPIKRAAMEDALKLLLEKDASGKLPARSDEFIRAQWDAGDIEPRYLAVVLAGALRDARCTGMLIEASKDKLLKMRLTAIESLGKLGSPEAVAALRGLLKDEKATVAREAARALIGLRDVESLPALLEWARKNASAVAPASVPAGKDAGNTRDPNRAKNQSVALDVLQLAAENGALLEPEQAAPALLDLARSKNETLAREALGVLASIAQAPQIASLIEIADDRTSEVREQAFVSLQRVTLTNYNSVDELRAWWAQNAKTFGEDAKRERVETAAKKLARPDQYAERRAALDVLRTAPAPIALVSAAPLLMKTETSGLFGADDLAAINSPLVLPFLLERLGRQNINDRRDALLGVVRLCVAHPRLQTVLWPLVRGELADEDSGCRRVAQTACGRFGQADCMRSLLDAVQYGSTYESQDSTRAIYQLSGRTLGFSVYEPVPDEVAARVRLRGWWGHAQKNFVPLTTIMPASGTRVWSDLDPAARGTKLESFIMAPDSRRSAAAFAIALAERQPSDPLWTKLLAQGRQRDRAYGILGTLGGDGTAVPALNKIAFSEGDAAEPPLCRALAMVSLATQGTNGAGTEARATGPAAIADWLKRAGGKADATWRRLALVSLALAKPQPEELAEIEAAVKAGLADREPDTDAVMPEDTGSAYAMLIPSLVALSARGDGPALLQKIMSETSNRRLRDWCAYALAHGRQESAVPAMLTALTKGDRYSWQGLSRALQPLLKPTDTAAVATLLESENSAARSAGASLLAQQPALGTDAETRGRLITGLDDRTNLVRYYCAMALGKRRSTAAISKLVELLKDDDDDVRGAAAEALGEIGDKESCSAAAAASEFQYRPDVHWLKARAVDGGKAHISLLLKLIGSSAYIDQRAGLEALGYSTNADAIAALLKTFHNDESGFQTVAAEALMRCGDRTVRALREDLQSADKAVKARAIHLLARIDTQASRVELETAQESPDPALKALAKFALEKCSKK